MYCRVSVDDKDHPDYTPGLRECVMTSPRQVGCEAAHFFSVGVDVCQLKSTESSGEGEKIDGDPRIELETHQRQRYEDQERSRKREGVRQAGGTLALHIRSGDIFAQRVHHSYGQASSLCRHVFLSSVLNLKQPGVCLSRNLMPFNLLGVGTKLADVRRLIVNTCISMKKRQQHRKNTRILREQPPLQCYLRALEEEQWDRVDVLTNRLTDSTHNINSVVPALESKVAAGELTGNITFTRCA